MQDSWLSKCLDELDPRTAHAIRTAFFEGVTYEALATRLDMLRGAVDAVHERLVRLREDPRATAVVSDLDDIGTALNGALNASG